MLDPATGSATLKHPFSYVARATAAPPAPGGGHYASHRTQTSYSPLSSHPPAISVDRRGRGQDRSLYGSAKHLTRWVLFRLFRAPASRHAYRGYPADSRRSDG